MDQAGRSLNMPRLAYRFVLDDLSRLTASGKIGRDGDVLPAEPALAARYSVSRTTIRKVPQMLAEDNILASKAGIGWKIVSPEKTKASREVRRQLRIGIDAEIDLWGDFDYDRLLNGLKKGARECDCKLVLLKDSGDERLDGIILSRLNALWMNPQKDGAVFADSLPWINHGGERFWPIPALAFAAAFESGRPAAGFKSTIIRQERNHIPIQIWLTVQLPDPEYCIAAMAPDFPQWRKLSLLNRQWQGVSTRGNAVFFKPDQILPGAKIGFFAEKAVAVYPDCLFVQKTMLQPQFCYPEGSNVQLYGNPVGNFGKYLEIEILGESTELVSSWELLDRK